MRGKVPSRWEGVNAVRITPAYAGKSSGTKIVTPTKTDHPRLCGEKYYADFDHTCKNGITPAYAGKRS